MRSATVVAITLWGVISACKPSQDDPTVGPDGGPTDGSPTDTDTDTDTDTVTVTTPTGTTGDTAPEVPEFDCSTIPTTPVSSREVEGARGYHDVAFTPDGYIIGSATFGDLLKVDSDGQSQVFVPNAGTIQQMTWLPDGDLAVASEDRGVVRVAASGGSVVIDGDTRPYGLITGPDGMLYAADQSVVKRIDPATGASEIIVPRNTLPRGTPRVINFNLDYTKMYVGTYGGSQGRIYEIPLDANLDPTGPPVELARGVGSGAYHDGLGVDICGYLYIPDYSTSALYRVSPSGQVQLFQDTGRVGSRDYVHGLEWGNGVDSFREDALYLPRPYGANKVTEIVIGVPSREWTGGVAINLP